MDTRSAFQAVIRAMSLYEPSAFSEFSMLVRGSPEDYEALIREFIASDEDSHNVDLCIHMLRSLFEIERDRNERWILHEWPKMGWLQRRKVAYGAHDATALTTDFALKLFNHSSSEVADRHLIAAGLASTARTRGTSEIVLSMLPKIGKYENAEKQATLNDFIQSAVRSFSEKK